MKSVVLVAGLAAPAAALSPSLPSFAATGAHNVPPSLSVRNVRRLNSFLKSSLEEIPETEDATRNIVHDGVANGNSEHDQLRRVLSSPELLDPAAILDATIGSPELTVESLAGTAEDETIPVAGASNKGAADSKEEHLKLTEHVVEESLEESNPAVIPSSAGGFMVGVTPDNALLDVHKLDGVTPATESSKRTARKAAAAAASSKEQDLELTRQAILSHIEQISFGDSGTVDDDDDEETNPPQSQTELAVSDAASKTTTTTSLVAPSVSKILRYTVPAIGIWLCSPVLSMIDTAAVGLLSGTAQQAALNPAVSVTDYGALVVAFMYTATTNLIAAAVQEDKDDSKDDGRQITKQPKTTETLITALKLALLVGSVFGIALGASGKLLLRTLIGNDALDPMVFSAALQYVRIRSLGMPAMVVIGTAQSACLGMQDVKSPLYVLAAAAIVNFLGDVVLVPRGGMFGGAAGAAWATVASQYAALLFFGRWLTATRKANSGDSGGKSVNVGMKKLVRVLQRRRNNKDEVASNDNGNNGDSGNDVVNVTQGIMELTGTSRAGRSRRREFRKFLASSRLSRRIRHGTSRSAASTVATKTAINGKENENGIITRTVREEVKKAPPTTRGFLSNYKLTLRSYLSPTNLNKPKAREFLPFVVPVTTTSVGRISGYIAMSHVASSTLGTFDMAGHQIVFSIFCCLTPFVDALSQVAQSFVPSVFEAKGRTDEALRERARALRETIMNFRKVGVGFGALLVSLVACIPLISRYFTTDPIVLERVKGAVPGVGLFMLVNGLMCAGEGSLLGQKDLKFLRNMYAIFFLTVPSYMLRLKGRALAGVQAVGIGTMWGAFATYNVIRASVWHLRLAQLQRRAERGVVMAADASADGGAKEDGEVDRR